MTVVNKSRAELEEELRSARARITELEASERERAHLQAIVESTTDLVSTSDPAGNITFINDAGRRLLGIPADADINSYKIEDLHPAKDFAHLQKVGLPTTVREGTYSHETTVISQNDGKTTPVSQVITAHTSQQGEIEFFSTIMRDISARKASERKLRTSEERFRNIIDASPMGMHLYRLDDSGALIFIGANTAAERLLGVSHEQFIGKSIEEAFPPLAETEVPRRYREAAREGKTWETRQINYDDDTIAGAFQVVAFQTSPGTMAALFLDITENLRREEEKRQIELQLQHQQKLESIGTLAAGVAHEINNPINGILNYAQLIANRLDDQHPSHRYAERIISESERVANIVRNLLSFSRQDTQAHSPARLVDIVENTTSLLEAILRKDQIQLRNTVSNELPKVRCRSQQIQQVLMNLITNAKDSLNQKFPGYDDNKVIEITAKTIETDAGSRVRLKISDRGVGIPREDLEKIFDPFFTTKPRTVGTGLGLSVSYGIINEHDSELRVTSKPGVETTFQFDLAVAENGKRSP